jgi:hypothetical protein
MAATATLVADNPWTEPVFPQDVQTSALDNLPAKYTDEAALSIVVQDYRRASAWLENRRWPLQWTESDLLYQSPRALATFENSTVTRSNVSRFTVAKQVSSLAPAIHGAVFSDTTPFEIRPRPSAHQNTARAWKELISELLDQIHFKAECNYGIHSMVNMGTAIFKAGWETVTQVETHYRRKAAPLSSDMPFGPRLVIPTEESDEFEAVDIEITRNRPTFELIELGNLFIDPTWHTPNQIWRAKWIVHCLYLSWEDLDKLRENPAYDIPSEEQLRAVFMEDVEVPQPIPSTAESMLSNLSIHHAERPNFEQSEDPRQKTLQVLEWWSDEQVRVVLQQKVVIRNENNDLKMKPFFSSNYWDIPNAGYGIGVGRVAGADQRVEQGLTNALLDIIAFAVQPEYAVARGANVPTQDQRRRLGGIRLVDGNDATRAIALVPQPDVPASVWNAIQMVVGSAEAATGADQPTVQGTLPGRGSSFARSGTGAGIVGQASASRLQSPVERFIDGVFLPFLDFVYRQVKERMPISEIRNVLAERTSDLQVDFQDFLSQTIKFDTLAGSRLSAKAKMAQALPFLMEVFSNQAVVSQMTQIGWKVNVTELVSMILDMSEWKNQRDLVIPMTTQEVQQMQQQAGAQAEASSKQSILHQQQQGQMQLEDRKIAGRIAVNAIKQTHGAAVETPLDRASSFAERTADERTMQSTPFFAPQSVGGS